MSAASTQRTCGRKVRNPLTMTTAERRASDLAYRRKITSGRLSVPPHARKRMNLTPKETAS